MSDSVTLRTVACQAPLSLEFSRQGHWSGLPCRPPGDLPNPGMELRSPALRAGSLPADPSGRPMHHGLSRSVMSDSLQPPRYLFPISLFPSLPSRPSSQVMCYLFYQFILICSTWPGSRRSSAYSVCVKSFFFFLGSLEKAPFLSATVVPNENI